MGDFSVSCRKWANKLQLVHWEVGDKFVRGRMSILIKVHMKKWFRSRQSYCVIRWSLIDQSSYTERVWSICHVYLSFFILPQWALEFEFIFLAKQSIGLDQDHQELLHILQKYQRNTVSINILRKEQCYKMHVFFFIPDFITILVVLLFKSGMLQVNEELLCHVIIKSGMGIQHEMSFTQLHMHWNWIFT